MLNSQLFFWLLALFSVIVAKPTLYICSDSTTANYTVGSVRQGWGFYISEYLIIEVSNQARNGRSTRSFINEGLWVQLLSSVKKGDFVLIEMGHNDDGDPTAANSYADRATLPGIGEDTVVVTTLANVTETVHSFGWYLRKMIADVEAMEAMPILSGMVNRNYWTGDVLQSDWAFATYAEQVAAAARVEYLDHTEQSVKRFQSMGPTLAKTYFPTDNTHTSPDGARINAENFVAAVKIRSKGIVRKSQLVKYLNKKGKRIQVLD